MSDEEKLERILVEANCKPVMLTDKEVWSWQQRWREVYAAPLHAATGAWVYNGYDWHVFSFDKYPHVHGDDAWSAFRRVEPGPFLVLAADSSDTFGFSCDGVPSERLDRGSDIVIAPPSMAWTMAFNHERFGPYFAEMR